MGQSLEKERLRSICSQISTNSKYVDIYDFKVRLGGSVEVLSWRIQRPLRRTPALLLVSGSLCDSVAKLCIAVDVVVINAFSSQSFRSCHFPLVSVSLSLIISSISFSCLKYYNHGTFRPDLLERPNCVSDASWSYNSFNTPFRFVSFCFKTDKERLG